MEKPGLGVVGAAGVLVVSAGLPNTDVPVGATVPKGDD
jgi:hypothetical protein